MKCCLCNCTFNGYGNNTAPLADGYCCDVCNTQIIIPYRFLKLGSTKMLPELRASLIGKQITIINMKGKPQYTGKSGVIDHIDDIGQIHGTWGGLGICPKEDEIKIINKEEK